MQANLRRSSCVCVCVYAWMLVLRRLCTNKLNLCHCWVLLKHRGVQSCLIRELDGTVGWTGPLAADQTCLESKLAISSCERECWSSRTDGCPEHDKTKQKHMLLVSELLSMRTVAIVDWHNVYLDHLKSGKYTFYMDFRFTTIRIEANLMIFRIEPTKCRIPFLT